jgi:hypothetical protein
MLRRMVSSAMLAAVLAAALAAPGVLAKPAPNYSATLAVAADCTVTITAGWHYIKVDEIRFDFTLDATTAVATVDDVTVNGSRDRASYSATASTDGSHDWSGLATFLVNGNEVGSRATEVVSANCAQ